MRNYRIKFLSLLILVSLLSTIDSLAQSELVFKHLPPLINKKSINVYRVIQDKSGYIWIALGQGAEVSVYRYDGIAYKKVPEFEGTLVSDFLIDKADNFWVSSSKGLHLYEPKRGIFKLFPIINQLDISYPNRKLKGTPANIRAISEDQAGNFWLATSSGIFRWHKKTEALKHYYFEGEVDSPAPVFMNNMYRYIHVDKSGKVWANSQRLNLVRLDTSTAEFTRILYVNKNQPETFKFGITNDMHEDAQGNLWVGSLEGLHKINGATLATEHFPLTQKRVNKIYANDDGNLWLGTHEGLIIFNPITKAYQVHKNNPAKPNSLDDAWVSDIMKDQRGDIWLTTYGGNGVHFVDQTVPKFSFIKHEKFPRHIPSGAPFPTNRIYGLLEDTVGDIWIGSEKLMHPSGFEFHPLSKYHPATKTVEFYDELSDNFVFTIFEDHQNNIWVGTLGSKGGLNLLNKTTNAFEHYYPVPNPVSLKEKIQNNINKIFEDSQHRLWLITAAGLSQFNRIDNSFTQYYWDVTDSLALSTYYPDANFVWNPDIPSARSPLVDKTLHLSGLKPLDIQEDETGNLWLLSDKGLSQLELTTQTYRHVWPDTSFHLRKQKEGPYFSFSSILKGTDNTFWLTASDSLWHFDCTTKKGVAIHPDLGVLKFMDEQGHLWLKPGLTNVLNRYHPETKTVTSYGDQDGLIGSSFLAADFGFKPSKSGNRLFAYNEINAIVSFNPKDFQKDQYLPPIHFSSMEKYNVKQEIWSSIPDSLVLADQPLVLSHQDDILKINAVALNYNRSEANQYAYKMEGIYDNWVQLGANNEITLTDLPDGAHTLQVKGSNDDGIWNEEGIQIPFYVTPPWWRTWWAKLLYALAAILSILGYTQWRTIALKKQQKVLEQTVSERTAEVVAQKDQLQQQNEIISKEKERSEELLLNILPAEVAEELKKDGVSPARNYDEVTVLFTDFKQFTSISEQLSAKDLVAEVNVCFKAFDDITTKFGVEKIKTIGDAYMAAGGLHLTQPAAPKDVVLAALEMQQFIIQRKEERTALGLPVFEMRCGIHTGPVVAGIVGVKKFQYDIWGDTVNTASRMENNGEVGQVNISNTTYQIIKNNPTFSFIDRGTIEVKNKGLLQMYYVATT